MTKTKIRLAAAFSSLALVGIGLFSYQSHLSVPLLKAADTSALASSKQAPHKTTAKAGQSSPAITTPTSVKVTTSATAVSSKPAATKPTASIASGTHSSAVASTVASGQSLYADPASDIASGARAWAAANSGDAAAMNRLAATPMAQWFGDFSGSNIQSAVNNYVTAAANAGAVPQLVAYNIPERDCGSYSAGGASSAAAYQAWISAFAAGIGNRQAIVIVEPDALAGMDCLSTSDQTSRLQLLSYAIATLQSKTKAAVYLDAGNPDWQSAATMASRLTSAGISQATGFSLNVSNFETTSSNISYGTALSGLLGGKHFVIDTSRNGNGPASGATAWCNPDGRAFGNTPSMQTGNALVDAYLWIKGPGESDGSCGADQAGTAAPAAGTWWPQYALMLEQNSGW